MASEVTSGLPAPPRTRLLVLAMTGVLAVSVALRLPRMSQSLWYDEYCRTRDVLNTDHLAALLLHDVHNPLYNAFMYCWIGVFGDSEWSVRVPSLLAGYASLLLFCSIVRRRVGAWVAWGVGAWGALAPMHLWYSTEAKNNMFVLALSTLALWTVDRMIDRPTRGRAAAAALALLGAFYTDLVAMLVVIPLIVWSLVQAQAAGDALVRRLAAAVGLVFAAGSLPWVAYKAMHVDDLWRGYLEPFRPREMVELLGGSFMTGHAFAPLSPDRTYVAIGVLALMVPLMALGARALWRGGRSRVFVVLMIFGVSGMAITSAVVDKLYVGRDHFIYQPRNLLCVFYVLGVIIWTGIWRLRPQFLRAAVAMGVLGLALSASVVMLTVHRDMHTVDRPRSDWRAVAAAIDADAAHAPAVAVSRSPVLQLERYSDQIEVSTSWGKKFGMGELAAVDRAGVELYYIDDLDWWALMPGEMETWRTVYAVREVARVDRVVIYALDRR